MHGPWHMPEHPDEADTSAQERAAEQADFEALAEAHLNGEPAFPWHGGCGAYECVNGCDGAPDYCAAALAKAHQKDQSRG
jgi:hypothetical protein